VVWGYTGQVYKYNFETNCSLEIEPIESKKMIKLPDLALEDAYLWGWHLKEDFSDMPYY
jgi:hypothetical protein